MGVHRGFFTSSVHPLCDRGLLSREAWGGVSAQRDEEPSSVPGKFRPAYFPAGVPIMFMGVPAKRSGREAEEHLAGVAADVSAWAHLRDHHAARVQPKEKVPLSSRWFVMPGAT